MMNIKHMLCGLLLLWGSVGVARAEQHPDFEIRGMHLDMRTQVMTPDAIRGVVRELADAGFNTLLMEWEATFPFERHATLRNQYAYSPQEVSDLIAYSRSLGVEVIPLQNCFGHCEYILRHPRYAALREDKKETSQVCPLALDVTVPLFRELFAEIAAAHPSPYMHIGGDETRLLGHCKRCAKKVAEEGISALFVDYVTTMCRLVEELGKTPIIWSDMILQHPEAVDKLPKNLIVLDWNYGWEPNRFGDIEVLHKAGITVWGAPALRSSPDNIYLTDWNKHFHNLTSFVPFARANGYRGMINTSWSTSGQYGYLYDQSWEVLSMQPIREVYPLAAFRILREAFAAAVKQPSPLDTEAFIRAYAHTRFGLDEAGAQTLVDYFRMPQKPIVVGVKAHPMVQEAIDVGERLAEEMARLRPKQHGEEIEAWRLMLDIRLHYLRFKQVECRYESADFVWAERGAMVQELKGLLREGKALQHRFVVAHAGYLKHPEAAYGAWSYLQKMQTIYDTLIQ